MCRCQLRIVRRNHGDVCSSRGAQRGECRAGTVDAPRTGGCPARSARGALKSEEMTQHRARRTRASGAPVDGGRSGSSPVVSSARAKLSYRIDNVLARGTAPVIRVLALATVLLVIVAGAVLSIGRISMNGSRAGDLEGMWTSLMRTLDPGTMGADVGWPFRLVSLGVTVGGIFVVSTLIGLLANGIDQRLAELRRGRSHVVESGHILILGWSSKLLTLLAELDVAHETSSMACVVVLAPRDKVEMEDEIHTRLPNLHRLRIVVRSGDPSDPHEVMIGAPLSSRSIVILSEDDAGDALTVRTVLALGAVGLATDIPVITELAAHSRAIALQAASPLDLHPIVTHDWIARIAAQVCRNPTLAAVFQDLLDFEGQEIYFTHPPDSLCDRSVGEAVDCVADAVVIGIRRGAEVDLAPAPTRLIEPGDELIVVAETASAARFDTDLRSAVPDAALFDQVLADPEPDHIGIIGWSSLGPMLLEQLDHYLPLGSRIDVLIDVDYARSGPPDVVFQRFELRHTSGDTTDVSVLRRFLEPDSIDRVVVLADRASGTSAVADSRVLLTLLELRQVGLASPVRVVAELLDARDVELVHGGGTEEFIIGDRLTSLLMAQLAEQGNLSEVFDLLLAAEGPEISVLPATSLGELGHETTVAQLTRHLVDRNAYLIGFRTGSRVTLNPPRDGHIRLDADVELIVVRPDVLDPAATAPAQSGTYR
jgi:ion channel POLLUX/CASTOR